MQANTFNTSNKAIVFIVKIDQYTLEVKTSKKRFGIKGLDIPVI